MPILFALIMALQGGPPRGESVPTVTFGTDVRAEAIVTLTVTCERCAWGVAGREAVMLSLAVDGRYSQHLPIMRTGRAEYKVMLGALEPGSHTVNISEDSQLTAAELRGGLQAIVHSVGITLIDAKSADYTAVSMAPIVYARPDTVGMYTDVPAFMWYEIEPTARGTRYRYSVIFTNEDGGTPADRLMATWGRTTDIEYLYSIELDDKGAILDEDIQGPKHEILPFDGRREGRHPLLWVSTSNNMVLPQGTTQVRYAPAPVLFRLRDVSREAVMDAHPWLYEVMARELEREGKIAANPPIGQGTIADPRQFVFVEGCAALAEKALAFAVRVGSQWISSDRGHPGYRIVRDGCFRASIPLPPGATIKEVRGVRTQVFAREGRTNAAPAQLTRINTVFGLSEMFAPGPPVLSWVGKTELQPAGPPFDLPIP